jgi:cobalt-zinc-cadmium resistance protein CzcA
MLRAGTDLASAATAIRNALEKELRLPAGCFWALGGRSRAGTRAGGPAARGPPRRGRVFVLLYLALDSLLETIVVLGTLPIAFVGGSSLWIGRDVKAPRRPVGLFGIAVQNALVLITQTKSLLARG